MKFLTPLSLYTIFWSCIIIGTFAQENNGRFEDDDDSDEEPLEQRFCNFIEMDGEKWPRFHGTKDNPTICEVPLIGKPALFTYACSGVSHPWNCPHSMIYQGYTVMLTSLFYQVTVHSSDTVDDHNSLLYTTLASKNKLPIDAHCTCESFDGTTYTMRLYSRLMDIVSLRLVNSLLFTFVLL